jgi:hypothetical protein
MNRIIIAIILGLAFTADLALADTTWVSWGNVSGTWSAAGSPYMIQSDVEVAQRDTLRISHGVRVYFTGLYRIKVYGSFAAVGTENDRIVFTTDTSANELGWGGIWLLESRGTARFDYCLLENGRAIGNADFGLGGAILCDSSTAVLQRTVIQSCMAGSGHAIFMRDRSNITLIDCVLKENGWLSGSGGAICCRQSILTLDGTTITENTALYGGGLVLDGSTAVIRNSHIQKNSAGIFGGGLYCNGSYLTMEDSWLVANNSLGGGGLDGRLDLNLTMDRCVIAANTAMRQGAEGPGGGLALMGGEQHLTNCTFFGNQASAGGGVYAGGHTAVENCIFAGQTSGGAIYYAVSGGTTRYSCFALNDSAQLRGSGIPSGMGRIDRTNLNRDSCDVHLNIFLNPLFDDSSAQLYRLTAGSPCINAGNPNGQDDPDGTIADIGAFPYTPSAVADPNRNGSAPESFSLTAYPNPFNAVTTIPFELAQTGDVSLRIFDLLGREVALLVRGRMEQGSHTVQWNAVLEPTGTYLAVLEQAGARQVHKLLLLK